MSARRHDKFKKHKKHSREVKRSDGDQHFNKMDAESEDDDFVLDRLDNLEQETLVELDSKNQLGSAKRKKKFVPSFEMPGVHRVVLDANSQVSMGIKVGVDVTGLNAWKCVKKELLLDNVTVYGDDSAFAHLKADLEAYEDDDILMGYIFDESTDVDEFYACLTIEAKERCEDIHLKAHEKTMKSLERSVYRIGRPWKSLGSEKEVDDFILKTNRPLIKVEVKTIFPRPNQPKYFQVRNPDDVKDGYSELVPDKLVQFENVIMTRIEAAVQAVPQKSDSEAQTEPKFPQNMWTQCSVTSNEVLDICAAKEADRQTPESEQDKKKLKKSASKDEAALVVENLRVSLSKWAPSIESMLEFNGVLDIYNMDYPALKNRHETKPDDFQCEEIMLFKSVKAKDKVVSSISWHPFEADIFAVAYSDTCHVIKVKKPDLDQVYRDVHGENPVLAWSTSDSLNPKLYFEAHREVRTLSFCPYESDILVGGCSNGQVVLWDMMGKLKANDSVEFLSDAKKEFRAYIASNKGWMKEYDDSCVVRQAVSSDLKNGHKDAVKDIVWLEPKWSVDKGGKINLVEDDCKSMQFMTVALDGLLIIWDLKIGDTNDLQKKVKSDRVDMDLSELGLRLSKYTVLDNCWSPLFKVIVRDPNATLKSPLTCIAFKEPHVETTIEESTDYRYPDKEITRIVHNYWLGSLYGDVYKITWAGQELESEDVLKDEYSKFDLKLTIHDGPISCCTKNPLFHDIFATVGGKVFAVWSDALMGKPLFWKKMNYYLTHLAWSPHVPSQLFVTTQEGDVDIWEFTQRSDAPIKTQKISGDPLTGLYFNKVKTGDRLVAVGDDDGCLRLFRLSESCYKLSCTNLVEAKKFFDRALEAQQACQEWQDKWFADHAEMMEKRKAEELVQKKERERQMRLKIRKEQERKELEEQKAKEVKVKVVDHEEMWRKLQWRHAVKTIQEKRHLDKMKLLKLERPLKELEAETMSMSIKRIEILKRQELVFNETVSILFPQAVQTHEVPSTDAQTEPTEEMRSRIMDDYKEISAAARKFMEENPYEYEFDWQKSLGRGRQRRKILMGSETVGNRRCPDWCPLKLGVPTG